MCVKSVISFLLLVLKVADASRSRAFFSSGFARLLSLRPVAHARTSSSELFSCFVLRIFWKASKTFGARKVVLSRKKKPQVLSHSCWPLGHPRPAPKAKILDDSQSVGPKMGTNRLWVFSEKWVWKVLSTHSEVKAPVAGTNRLSLVCALNISYILRWLRREINLLFRRTKNHAFLINEKWYFSKESEKLLK